MKLQSMEELFIHECKDLLSAEKQLVKALPKMAKGAANEQLRMAFEEHLEQTKSHVERLEQVFAARQDGTCRALQRNGRADRRGFRPSRRRADTVVKDAALIGAAQKVEHYEISGYGTARTLAELLGHQDVVELLQQTLDEEKETDKKLTELAMNEFRSESAHAEK